MTRAAHSAGVHETGFPAGRIADAPVNHAYAAGGKGERAARAKRVVCIGGDIKGAESLRRASAVETGVSFERKLRIHEHVANRRRKLAAAHSKLTAETCARTADCKGGIRYLLYATAAFKGAAERAAFRFQNF
jgi:hypothetical protein